MRNIFITSKPGFYFNLVIAVLNLVLFFCFGHWYNAVAGGVNILAMYGTNPYRKDEKSVLEYDDRWDDSEYVAMIHRTRKEEADNDIPLTECKCSSCKVFTDPPKRVESSHKSIVLPPRTPEYFDRETLDQEQKTSSLHIINGYAFNVPSFVPTSAEVSVVENGYGDVVSAYFSWYDLTGKKFGFVASTLNSKYVENNILTTNEIRTAHYNQKFDRKPEHIEKSYKDRLGELPPGWEVY